MKAQVFDSRRCNLGEGPTSSGAGYNEVMWVDILNSKVMSRNLRTGMSAEFECDEHVGFAIPRSNGGQVLGTTSGLTLRNSDGLISSLPISSRADWDSGEFPIRWNDAKVSPLGDLWLGTMTYDMVAGKSALYRLSTEPMNLERVLSDVTISNGMDWSNDGKTMFYIDTALGSVDAFSVAGIHISKRRTLVEFSPEDGSPDGMCADAEGGIWVAFWDGGVVRRFDSNNNYLLTEVIQLPVPFVTSCAFAGDDLSSLIITTASLNDPSAPLEAGMTFIYESDVQGRATPLFSG